MPPVRAPGHGARLRLAVAGFIWPRVLGSGVASRLGPDGRLALLWSAWRWRWDNAGRRGRADLAPHEESRHSQNGEDGILAEILRRLAIGTGTVVEIGAADGDENCTRALVDDGWRAVWFEADPTKVRAARAVPGDVTVIEAFVSSDNITRLLDDADVPPVPDILVIDIDGNDYWVLAAILRERRPRVLVAEYNGCFGGPAWWVRPNDPERTWDGTAWFGVGLAALTDLAERAGYSLVACDSQGVNAFFVRAADIAAFMPGSPRDHFVAPAYRLPFGHPWRSRPAPEPAPSLDVLTVSPIGRRRRGRVGGVVHVPVVLHNRGSVHLHNLGSRRPLSLASRWASSTDEPGRRAETVELPPRSRRVVLLRIDVPERAGRHELEVFAVQEDVGWMGGQPRRALARITINAS
jgi:hypothetical protein